MVAFFSPLSNVCHHHAFDFAMEERRGKFHSIWYRIAVGLAFHFIVVVVQRNGRAYCDSLMHHDVQGHFQTSVTERKLQFR